jgi:acyl-CoA synthetase (AMP-forming)/AMP-acid ligase II
VALQVDQLRHMAEHHPERVAYVDLLADDELTFAGWEADANRLARGLAAAGVRPGDRVAIFLESSHPLRWVVAYSAIHKAGAVAVPTNTRLSARELAAVLGHAEPRVVITSSTLRPVLDQARPELPSVERVVEADTGDWWDLLAPDDSPYQEPVTEDDLADIMYTSGTTGLPKGIAVRHRSLHIIPNAEPEWTDQLWLHGSPLFTFAGISFVYNPMKMGMGALYLSRFDAGRWLSTVEERRPAMAFIVPAMAQLIVTHERFESADLSSLSMLSIGSAPLPPALHRRFAERLPDAVVTNNYSMTEAGTAFTYLPKEELDRRAGSVGIPMGTEVRIVDDDGEPLPAGQVGEVQIRVGENRREYYKDPEASARTWVGEWLRTGDLGYLDEDGYLYISGRAKDVIIRGGNNVHAADVEAVLYEHPAVLEAAVAAVPHEVLGEDVGAWVVLRPGQRASTEELTAFCAERLADYKVPRVVTFLDALPRNPTGKVLKRELPPPATPR